MRSIQKLTGSKCIITTQERVCCSGRIYARGESGLRIRESQNLRDYPNSRYFSDFDFAVMAGGYNSFHEVIQASLPTICLPNMKKLEGTTNSQELLAEEAGCMVVIRERNRNTIQAAIDRIVETDVREVMGNNFQLLKRKQLKHNWISQTNCRLDIYQFFQPLFLKHNWIYFSDVSRMDISQEEVRDACEISFGK